MSTSNNPTADKQLIDATRLFARDERWVSWLHTLIAFSAIALAEAIAFAVPWWPLRLAAAITSGLLIIRGFILYHDFLHGAILRKSPIARALYYTFGVLVLTPPRVWRETHNYHHSHTAILVGSHVGSYATVNIHIWNKMSPREKLMYKIIRHPLTIMLGYFTIFLYGMCVSSFLRNPKKNWDSALALLIHSTLAVALCVYVGPLAFVFGVFIPLLVACALGAYLFYAQHNFPGMHIQPREEWTYTRAALESSSFMKTGRVMSWITGNIGYHHVHHLNPSIPFYKLPAAMAAIPELQNPEVTSLGLKDIIACFKLKIWDSNGQIMTHYPK